MSVPCEDCITKAICLNKNIVVCNILYNWVYSRKGLKREDYVKNKENKSNYTIRRDRRQNLLWDYFITTKV